ncbi:MAG: N-acetyl-gamma-glutamyl-phosphate reductase [Candidatus Omnitrophica bacterium]|nr:N-acetyl-gamma-glutamyl-phosphate reductase [Candidatus Omnitrophota bacterium]
MKNNMIRAGIVGVSGYSGLAVLELLLKHPKIRLTYVSAHNTSGSLDEIWPQLANRTKLICEKFSLQNAIEQCDIIFLAVPHTSSMDITPKLIAAGKRIIDLSGDYRLKHANDYEQWYAHPHTDTINLKNAIYGLPEMYREKIKTAQLLSNPGCYPTAALLGSLPAAISMTDNIKNIIIDAKSGVSGAGKKMTASLMFCEVNENFKAYKVFNHQHSPEIDNYLANASGKNFDLTFITHLLPINKGILETIYIQLHTTTTIENMHSLYTKFYKNEPFVRVRKLGVQPELKDVVNTNFCDIGIALNPAGNLIVVTSIIDNLIKGAAGQAVQNMNIMCGFAETEGLL